MRSTPITTMMLHWSGPDLRVQMATELICPHCFRPLRPGAVRRDPDALNLICERCGLRILQVELLLAEKANGG